MHERQLPEAVWRKSSYSGQEGNECVEVAILDALIAVRDSKDPGAGYFAVPDAGWAAFLAAVAK